MFFKNLIITSLSFVSGPLVLVVLCGKPTWLFEGGDDGLAITKGGASGGEDGGEMARSAKDETSLVGLNKLRECYIMNLIIHIYRIT